VRSESFPTDPSGLPEAGRPALLELADGETLELQVGPVAKRLGQGGAASRPTGRSTMDRHPALLSRWEQGSPAQIRPSRPHEKGQLRPGAGVPASVADHSRIAERSMSSPCSPAFCSATDLHHAALVASEMNR
jgi:hypothetical protein